MEKEKNKLVEQWISLSPPSSLSLLRSFASSCLFLFYVDEMDDVSFLRLLLEAHSLVLSSSSSSSPFPSPFYSLVMDHCKQYGGKKEKGQEEREGEGEVLPSILLTYHQLHIFGGEKGFEFFDERKEKKGEKEKDEKRKREAVEVGRVMGALEYLVQLYSDYLPFLCSDFVQVFFSFFFFFFLLSPLSWTK